MSAELKKVQGRVVVENFPRNVKQMQMFNYDEIIECVVNVTGDNCLEEGPRMERWRKSQQMVRICSE